METWPNHVTDEFFQLDLHSGFFWIPGTIPYPAVAIHVSADCHLLPELGHGESKSNDWNVLADGIPVVSRGHSCEERVGLHLNVPPIPPGINVLIPFLIWGSSTQCIYAVGSVRCKDGPIAVSVKKQLGYDWSCHDAAELGFCLPTSFVSNQSTVNIGFTLGDLRASLIIALYENAKSIATSIFFKWLGKRQFIKDMFESVFKQQIMTIMRGLDIPRTFRNEQGRFTSGAEEFFKAALGLHVDAKVDELLGSIDSWVEGYADRKAAEIDGYSELLGE